MDLVVAAFSTAICTVSAIANQNEGEFILGFIQVNYDRKVDDYI